MRKVARDLDIHPNLVHQWRRIFMTEGDSAFVVTGNLKTEDAEFTALNVREIVDWFDAVWYRDVFISGI